MIYRDGNTLYFSRWAETPEYLEYVVAVNVETGEEISVEKGNLYRMPDGSFWLVKSALSENDITDNASTPDGAVGP